MPSKFLATFGKDTEVPFTIDTPDTGVLSFKKEDSKTEINYAYKKLENGYYSIVADGQSYVVRFAHDGIKTMAYLEGETLTFNLEDARTVAKRIAKSKGAGAGLEGKVEIKSMMPGKIVAVKVKEGDAVTEGQGLVILEAMKMENEIASPKAGKVTSVTVSAGQSIESGSVMIVVE